jgi:hypothetical protein
MERMTQVLLGAVLAVPAVAMAGTGDPMGAVGVYLTNTSLEVPASTFDEDGTGFGVKGYMAFGVPFVHFEYQSVTVGDGANEVDEDQFRIGGGAAFKVSEPFMLIGKAEYIDFGIDDGSGASNDLDGFGLHGGAMFIPGPAMQVGATLGFLQLSGEDAGFGDTDGLELNVGAGFHFTKQFGAFIDYRTFMGSWEAPPAADDELTASDIRLGGTFSWGG